MKMKDSGVEWIGEIPENWELRKIKYILNERKEKNNPIETNFILSLSMERGVFPYSEKVGGGNKAKEDLTAYKIARPNDIVINSMNILAGSVGISKWVGAVSPVYYTYFSKDEDIDIYYYHYLFQCSEFQKSLLGLGNGIMMKETENGKLNTIRMRIPSDKLGNLLFPIPTKIEQQKIADFLDSKIALIDQIIVDTKRSIEELKAYKQSLITETVTKGLDPNVPMKDSGVEWIGEMPKEWQLSTYKYIAKIRNGKEITVDGGEVPVYGSGGIFKWTNEPLFIGESVLFGRKGSIGEPMIASGEFWTVDTMYYTEINKSRTSLKYCYYLSKSLPWDFYKTKTALPSIVGTQIESIKIPLPDKEEQDSITKFLDEKVKNIDNLIFGKQNLITDYESYKKSLIYEYVTGKKQVN